MKDLLFGVVLFAEVADFVLRDCMACTIRGARSAELAVPQLYYVAFGNKPLTPTPFCLASTAATQPSYKAAAPKFFFAIVYAGNKWWM